ncbi:MAG: molecular chaperone TorD family protein [Ilumatobacteraceae bacterium]
MTSDLALIAERRGGLAALLGLLTLEEPGPGLAPLVADIPALAPLAWDDPAIATEYERVFLRGVPLYESVFRSEDGHHGGEAVTAIVERYERLGFREHLDRRWRVAGGDHLGLQLRCLAYLCHEEATAWRSGTPDKAMEMVETERMFLAHHLAGWAPVAVHFAIRCVGESAYSPLLTAIADHLTDEFDRLRPAPDLGSQIDIEPLPTNLGPARLARLLLAPASSGTWLSSTVIGRASRSIGAPWRPSDTRSALRHVIEDAHDTGDLDIMLEPIADDLDEAIAWHRQDAERSPGNATNARRWALTAQSMRDRLGQIGESGLNGRSSSMAAETFTVSGSDPGRLTEAIDKVLSDLCSQGFCVERHVDAAQLSGASSSALS